MLRLRPKDERTWMVVAGRRRQRRLPPVIIEVGVSVCMLTGDLMLRRNVFGFRKAISVCRQKLTHCKPSHTTYRCSGSKLMPVGNRKAVLIRILVVLGLFSALVACPPSVEGQASYTASRRSDFSLFGGLSEAKPDFGSEYKSYKSGIVVGGDATYHFGIVALSFEPRFGHTSASSATQNYFTANLKAEASVGPAHRLHPYGFGGIGYGTISTGFHDNSTVYAAGAGVDVDLTHAVALKGEFQYQFWNLGSAHTTFNPNGYAAALMYRFSRLRF